MDIVYSVILVGSLIFVHELGHFLWAKAFGVKVITFSLGFGPKILRLRGRETEYCVGLFPLGGYVRMLESARTDIVLPEDRSRTFESLSVWKRIIIVLAGPLMNLLFPVLLYFSVFVTDGPFLPPTVGVVLPGHAAHGKLHAGDRIMAVNGVEIGTFEELNRIVVRSPKVALRFKVFRDNKYEEVEVIAEERVERRQLAMTERVGTIGIAASAPAAVIGVPSPSSPAHRAGLRTFDVVTHVGGEPVRRFADLVEALKENRGETVPITYQRPVRMPDALGGLADMAVFETGVAALTPASDEIDLIGRTGIEFADLYVAVVPEDSYLYKAGLRPRDRILMLDDEAVPAWSAFLEYLDADRDRPHTITYRSARDGHTRACTVQVRREVFTDEYGQTFAQYIIPIEHWVPLAPEERVRHPAPIRYALGKALQKTIDDTHFILVAIVRTVQGRLSIKNISGPITILEMASQEGRKGADHFMWLMAVISINLGLLNLLPIPVLDGGHILFFLIEAAMRRPLPLRAREVAHLLGMALLVGLIALAFKNDVEQRWDVILAHVRELVS